jgi:hypothetical protein
MAEKGLREAQCDGEEGEGAETLEPGGGGKVSTAFTTKTLKSRKARPSAMAKSQAFILPATRSSRVKNFFIKPLALSAVPAAPSATILLHNARPTRSDDPILTKPI